VLTQTYENIEIILINDGSTDGSRVICEEYAISDLRVTLINKENGGLSDTRNVGIAHAKGEYIAFVDSDDYVHELFIERMYSQIESDNSDICMCAFHFVNEGDEDYSAITTIPDSYNYQAEGITEGLYEADIAMKHIANNHLVVAWNKLYRCQLFEDIRFPVGRLHEDAFILHRIFAKARNVSIISDKLHFYLQRSSSIMGQSYSVRRLDLLDAYADRMDFYFDNKNLELLKCTCLDYMRRYAEAYILLPKSKENLHHFKEKKKNFSGYRKIMFQYGGIYVGTRFLLTAISPRLSHVVSSFLYSRKVGKNL